MKRLLMATAAVLLIGTASASADTLMQIPHDVSAGHMNIRNGPGTGHRVIGEIPAGAQVSASQCVQRDDGIAGANWCFVTWGNLRGWVSQFGLVPVQAAKDASNLFSGGDWQTSYYPVAKGKRSEPICVTSTMWPSHTNSRMLMFKWQPNLGLFMEVAKMDWRLPVGESVPISIAFDSGVRDATGFVTEKDKVQIGINEDAAQGFMEDFKNAREVTISFPEGNEPTWKGGMIGSRMAGQWLDACISKVSAEYTPPTSPVGPKAAQPTSPINPTSKTKVKDDGSV